MNSIYTIAVRSATGELAGRDQDVVVAPIAPAMHINSDRVS